MKKNQADAGMAPRRSKPTPSMASTFTPPSDEEPMVHLTVQVPESMRRRVKALAATRGTSVREIVEAGLERELEANQDNQDT